MPLDLLFRVASMIAVAGWVILALAPLRRGLAVVAARVLAAVLCGGYAAVLIHALTAGPGPAAGAGFDTLDGVMALFTSRQAVLAGWVHYLAFDLFAGAWEVETAPAARVPHWLVLVCLALTFLAGPVGLLLYLMARATRQRSSARR